MSHSLVVFSILVNVPPLACINTSYSIADEKEITNDLRLLVIGAFAHHGNAFYEAEVRRCIALLKQRPHEFDARNDLAAAMTKLGRFAEAEQVFFANEELHPGRYKTASNLGVLYKKWGKFDLAEHWLTKALQIKPGGHMGLGDYYLKMVQWRGASPEHRKEFNFLGTPYSEGKYRAAANANRDYLITLIKNDMAFADAYLLLGDVAQSEADYATAARCYLRAINLGDHLWAQERFNDLLERWEAATEELSRQVVDRTGGKHIREEFKLAQEWLQKYQQLEAERVERGLPVDFATMKGVVKSAGLVRPVMFQRIVYDTKLMEPLIPRRFVEVLQNLLIFSPILLIIVFPFSSPAHTRDSRQQK